MPQNREALIAEIFVALSNSLDPDRDAAETLALLVNASRTLTAIDDAGVLLVDPSGTPQVIASTSEKVRQLETAQLGGYGGPCVDSIRSGTVVEISDLADVQDVWPHFSELALANGVCSVHSIPLRLRNRTIGAMNLFGSTIGPLSESDAALARALADVATISILTDESISSAHELSDQLQHALDSRVLVEQAKGVLAFRHKLSVEEAFARLRTFARTTGRRIDDVAKDVIEGRLLL